MNFEDINFPVYRKYKNNKSYFKISGPEVFEEIKVFGARCSYSKITATLYPERLFIHDLIYRQELTENSDAREFEALRLKAGLE
jgi:hypothetical protein